MSGTTWPALVAGAKAKASEVESKFDWIEGDFLPQFNGTKTDATYDNGSPTYRWRDISYSRQLITPAGSVGTPSVTISGSLTTGFYSPAGNQIAVSVSGTKTASIKSDGIGVILGSAAAPSVYGLTAATSGLYWPDTTSVGLSANGTSVLLCTPSGTGELQMRTGYSFTPIDAGTLSNTIIHKNSTPTTGINFGRAAANTIEFVASGAQSLNMNASGAVTNPVQPCFLAYKNTSSTGLSGAGNTITYDTEVFDQASNYNNGTYTFTASITGRYLFNIYLDITSFSTSATGFTIALVTSNRTLDYFIGLTSPSQVSTIPVAWSVITDLDNNDTAYVVIAVSGGVTFTVRGAANLARFSGMLVA